MIYLKCIIARRKSVYMPASSTKIYYGVIVLVKYLPPGEHLNMHGRNFINLDYVVQLHKALAPYGLSANEWHHNSKTDGIVIGKYLGEADIYDGQPASQVFTLIQLLDSEVVKMAIRNFLASLDYTEDTKADLYFVPNACHCCK